MKNITFILLFLSSILSAQSSLVDTQIRMGYGKGNIIGFTFSEQVTKDVGAVMELQYITRNNRPYLQQGVGASIGNKKAHINTTLFLGFELDDKKDTPNLGGIAMSFNYNFWKRFGGELRLEQSKTTNYYVSITYIIK